MMGSTNKRRRGLSLAALTLSLAAVFAAQAPSAHAAEVAGVPVAESVLVAGKELVLNGAGIRSKLFIKVYVGALYLGHKTGSVAQVLEGPAPQRISLRLLRDLDAATLQEALDDGLRNNLSAAELAAQAASAEQLASLMKGIGKVREGDTVTLDLLADGVTVLLNGNPRGKVASADFGKSLLRVWLGDKPADAGLKKALLGA